MPVCTKLSGFSRGIWFESNEELATLTEHFPLLPFSSPGKFCIIPDSSLITTSSCYFRHYITTAVDIILTITKRTNTSIQNFVEKSLYKTLLGKSSVDGRLIL
jgi:hypothetical protein